MCTCFIWRSSKLCHLFMTSLFYFTVHVAPYTAVSWFLLFFSVYVIIIFIARVAFPKHCESLLLQVWFLASEVQYMAWTVHCGLSLHVAMGVLRAFCAQWDSSGVQTSPVSTIYGTVSKRTCLPHHLQLVGTLGKVILQLDFASLSTPSLSGALIKDRLCPAHPQNP